MSFTLYINQYREETSTWQHLHLQDISLSILKKVNEFVEEMTKKATPTLTKNFSSRLQHEKDLKYNLHKALG